MSCSLSNRDIILFFLLVSVVSKSLVLFPDYFHHESRKQYWVNTITQYKYLLLSNRWYALPYLVISVTPWLFWSWEQKTILIVPSHTKRNKGSLEISGLLGGEEINTLKNWSREGKLQSYCRHLDSVPVSSKQSINKLRLSSIKNIVVVNFNTYKPVPCATMIFCFLVIVGRKKAQQTEINIRTTRNFRVKCSNGEKEYLSILFSYLLW